MRKVITLALLALTGAGSAQSYWNEQFDYHHQYEYMAGGVHTGDGLLFAGGRNNPFASDPYIYLLKLGDNGGKLWERSVGFGPSTEVGAANILPLNTAYSLIESTFNLVPTSTSWDSQHCFIKIDNATGDTLWVKTYGRPNYSENSGKMIRTADGGFALVGWSFKTDYTDYQQALLVKLDSLGNRQFWQTYTTHSGRHHYGWSLAQTPDGGYLLLCFTKYDGFCNGCPAWGEQLIEMVIFKADANGNQQWAKTYPVTGYKEHNNAGTDITALPNGNYLIAGRRYYDITTHLGSYLSDYYFRTINLSGEIVDSLSFENHSNCETDRMLKVSDSNYLVCGYELDTINKNGQTGLLLKVRPDGRPLWKREYRVSPPQSKIHDAFFNAIEMPDRGFVVCGRAYGPIEDSTYQNAWVIRVDSLGCLEPGCDSTITAAHDPPGPSAVGLSLSPNPTTGEARLLLSDPEAVLLGVRVLDIQGRTVSDVQYLRSAGWRGCVLDLGGQPAGVYVVQVRTSKGWGVGKVLRK